MSVVKHVMKLKPINPILQQVRNRTLRVGGFNHAINGPPMVRFPMWKKFALQGTFVVFMFSYPLYVTWMMHEWDLMDGNV